MKRSEYVEKRKKEWAKLGSDFAATQASFVERDVAAAEAAGIEWDPEEPELPRAVRWGQPWHAGYGGLPPIVDEATQKPLEGKLWHRWLEAALPAYNREREEEAMEAEHGAALDAGLSAILQDEMMDEINAGAEKLVATERARCAYILTAVRNMFRAGGGDPMMIEDVEAAIRKIESGESPNPYWTGADQDPILVPPEPPEPRPVDPADVEPVVQEERREEPRAWPDGLVWGRESHGGQEFGVLRVYPVVAQEAVRRWKEEPRLRAEVARLSREKATLQERAKVLGRERDMMEAERNGRRGEATELSDRLNRTRAAVAGDWPTAWKRAEAGDRSGIIGRLYCILTGKEE